MSPPFESTTAQGQPLAAPNAPTVPALAFPEEEYPHRVDGVTLRQLAVRYLHDPNIQVMAVRMEHGQDHQVRVVIELEFANL